MTNQPASIITTLLTRCRQLFLAAKLSANSRKLYLADIKRFLTWANQRSPLTPSRLGSAQLYQTYLREVTPTFSSSLRRRTFASLRRLGVVVASTYNLENPLSQLTLADQPISWNYLKSFTNYLKGQQLAKGTIKSYSSDVGQYLRWAAQHQLGTKLATLLTPLNQQKYLTQLTKSAKYPTSTLSRKQASLSRFQAWYQTSFAQLKPADKKPRTQPLSPPPASPELATPVPTRFHPSLITALRLNFSPANLLSLGLILLLTAGLAIFGYRAFSRDQVLLSQAYPTTPVTPNRQLSFQGRLEDSGGTPITSSTNFVFKLFDDPSVGSELYSSGTCAITPDSDGVFSTQIGGTCGSGIGSSVFTENPDVYLEVTVGAETLDPRQQIATVAYALNAETIQGIPLSSTMSAIANTVVPMNSGGEIVIGEQSPTMRAVSGTFNISAPALSLTTTSGSSGNISIAPDGTGQVNLTGNTTTTNFFNVSNAQLTTGSLITGTVGNNNTGFLLLDLLSGVSPTSVFSVSYNGSTSIGGTLTVGSIASVADNNAVLTSDSGIVKYIDTSTWDKDTGDDLSAGNIPWYQNATDGTLYPKNSTVDVLVGGTATASAKFAFTNLNSGTPTLSAANQASNISIKDNTANALQIVQGSDPYLSITTTDNAESFSLNLPVGGVTSHTANLFTANIAQTINIGTGTAADTINIGTGGTTADDINIGGLATSHTDFTGVVNLAGGTTYYVDASGNAVFADITALDTGNPGLTVGDGATGYAKIGGSTIYDDAGNLTLDSDSNAITIGATDTTLTATGLTTLDTAASVSWDATSLTLGGSSTLYGGSGVSGTLTLVSTSNATKGNLQFFSASNTLSPTGDLTLAGDLTLGGGNLNTGDIALTIGDGTTDSITFSTDGTGNGEIVLPNDSIGPNEILSTGQTDEYCLTYEATGTTWEWQTCGGGASLWTDGGNYIYPTGNEWLGNEASGTSTGKLTGIYLADSAPLTFGNDNDISFSYNGSTLALTPATSFTSGTILSQAYSSATTLTGALTGYYLDLNSNLSPAGQNVTGLKIQQSLANYAGTNYAIWADGTYGSSLALYDGAGNNTLLVADAGAVTAKPAAFDTVFHFDGTATYTNHTTEAKSNAGTPYTILATENPSNDIFYLGLDHPFNTINVDIVTAAAGYTLDLEYYNGATWTDMSPGETDNTSNLTTDGTITFTPPTNWATTSVNSVTKYWVRLNGNASNITTGPTAYFTSPTTNNRLQLYAQTGDSAPALSVIDNGNVGIGVTTPTSKLQIGGATSTISNGSGNININSASGTILFAEDDDLIPTLGAGDADLGSVSARWDNLYATNINFTLATGNITLADNTANAFQILEGSNVYLDITTTNDQESFTLNLPAGGATSHTANLFTSAIATDINIGGHVSTHTDFTGAVNFAGGTTYNVSSAGNATFLDIVALDTGNPGLTVGSGGVGYIQVGGSNIYDNAGNLTLDSDSAAITLAADDTTLTATGLATLDFAATVAWDVTTLNVTSLTALNTGALVLNTSDWDISATGDLTNIGSIGMDGDLTMTQATPSIFLTDNTASSDDYSINVDGNAFNITNATDSRVEINFSGAGGIEIGNNNTAKTVTIAGGTGADTINIGTGGTSADDINIGGLTTTTIDYTGVLRFAGTTSCGSANNYCIDASGNARFLDLIAYDTGNPGLTVGDGTTGYIKVGGSTVYDAAGDLILSSDSTTVKIGATGADKLDAGTVDPPYTINGDKYATYLPSMTGVKEETTGLVTTREYVAGQGYRAILDFARAPKGSDLWLFRETTKLQGRFDSLVILLSPAGRERAWYRLQPQAGVAEIYTSSPATVSYRLTAPRFDSESWANTRDSDSIGFVLNSPTSWSTLPLTPDPSFELTNYQIAKTQPSGYSLSYLGRQLSELVTASRALVAELTAGKIATKELTSPLISAETVTAYSLTATTLSASLTNSDLVISQEVETATLSARLAKLQTVEADVVRTRELVADSIVAGSIEGLDAKLATLSARTTLSEAEGLSDTDLQTITDRIKARLTELSGSTPTAQDLPAEASAEAGLPLPPNPPNPPAPDLAAYSLATDAATLASLDTNLAVVNDYLAVIGSAAITNLSISGYLYTDTLESQTGTLALQPTGGTVKLAQNTLIVDSVGEVMVNGNLTVKGQLLADSAALGSLSVFDETGQTVATINASGSANLRQLSTELITIAAPAASSSATSSALAQALGGESDTNATAGEATLTSPNTELVINSPFVTADSLVYLTPVGNPDNKVLFVKAKETCPPPPADFSGVIPVCTPSFTVGIDTPARSDISFNWWIIKLAKKSGESQP